MGPFAPHELSGRAGPNETPMGIPFATSGQPEKKYGLDKKGHVLYQKMNNSPPAAFI
jgi:hypothetical protein